MDFPIMSNETKDVFIERMAENLPILRKKLKWSQDSLAQIIGSSRYTVLQIESKKRKMTWNMFLSMLFVFDKNEDTAILLRALEIYPNELDSHFKNVSDKPVEPGMML